MKTEFIYVPIVKWKQGEQGALKELDESVKDKIVPLIEITPDMNLSRFESSLEFWENRYFYFDIIPEFYENYDGEMFFKLLNQCNPEYVIPVVFLSDPFEAIKEANDYTKNGIAIRLTNEDFENIEENLISLRKTFNYDEIDLIVDLKEINGKTITEKRIVLKAILSDIPEIKTFRNIIISSSSFPQSLSDIEKYKLVYLPRHEYEFLNSLKPIFNKLDISPVYSDYCINHPSFFEYIPGMTPSFNIRYTNSNSYIIMKGETLKKGGLESENVIRFCEKLINSGEFAGDDYSWGDNYIYTRCEEDAKSFGNLTIWRKVGTNHHITFVINQLSNLL